MSDDVVIVEAGRSAVGKRNGTLRGTHPSDILGPVMASVIERSGVDPAQVEQVIGGCVDQVGAQSMNITRTAWLSAGLPIETACSSVDTQCGSSQHGVNTAANLVAAGAVDIAMGVGVENMSMVPIGSNAADGHAAGHGSPVSSSYFDQFEFTSQFEGAERIATKYGITRDDTDALGLESQLRARRAVDEGRFENQIVALEAVELNEDGEKTGNTTTFTTDEVLRETSLEKLGALKPVAREDGIHTAGSSSQIADGAGALLVMKKSKADELGLKARARILQTALVGCDPVLMLEGPIPATQRMLDRAGMTMADVDVVEINEAFASVVLAWAKAMDADMDKVNPNGGAIALGHPLGGTGSILTTKALHELERTDASVGLITMCCGGGLGTGTLIERI
jgi:acetyl-CoA C-acetyltransferase